MGQETAARDAVGIARRSICLTLGVLLSVGVCAAEQFEAVSAATSKVQNSRIEASQIQAPIDATMARLRRLENVAGFDAARLSAANRNLFCFADRWMAVRERLLQGAAPPASVDF